jgi:hypothetical protein
VCASREPRDAKQKTELRRPTTNHRRPTDHRRRQHSIGRSRETIGSLYGLGRGQSNKLEGFNMKNGPEYYLGITEMLQAMDSSVDPCHDFCEYNNRLLS